MSRVHATILALLLGLAAVAGTFGALSTSSLGLAAEQASVSDAEIAAREAALDRAERRLERAAKRRPPQLPPVPARPVAAAGEAPLQAAPAVDPDDEDWDDDDEWDDDDDWDDDDRDEDDDDD
jgi:hypothetical protein